MAAQVASFASRSSVLPTWLFGSMSIASVFVLPQSVQVNSFSPFETQVAAVVTTPLFQVWSCSTNCGYSVTPPSGGYA